MKKSKNSNTHTIEDPRLYPYIIQMDQYGYALNKYVEAESNTRIKTVAYLSSMEQCLNRLAIDFGKSKDYTDIQDFLNTVRVKLEEIKELTSNI